MHQHWQPQQAEASRPIRAPHQQQTNRFALLRRRAAGPAVCAQESAAPGGAQGGSSSTSNNNSSSGSHSTRTNSRQQQHPSGRGADARWQQQQQLDSSAAGSQLGHHGHGNTSRAWWSAGAAPVGTGAGYTVPQQQPGTACSEVGLSRDMQAASSWQELTSLLLNYHRAAAGSIAVQQTAAQPSSLPHHHHHKQRQQQQQQELAAAIKHLNGRHLSRLVKTLARLQPLPAAPTSQAAATPPPTLRGAKGRSAAAGLSRQEQQAFWSLSDLAFSECLEQLPSLCAWELSSTLWAASKLAHAPPPFLLRRLLQQLAHPDLLAAATAQDISMSLYAVASLAMQVPEQQLEVLLAAAAQRTPQASPQALSNTLWAVATLQHQPQEGWLSQWEHCCARVLQSSILSQQQQEAAFVQPAYHQQQQQQQQQQQGLRRDQYQASSGARFTPKGLHQLIWAMAKLQWQPSPAFQAGFWSASLSQLQHMTPHGTAGILWGVASLALQPPPHWRSAWLCALQMQMQQGRCGSQDLGNALWAVARLGLRPDEGWLQDALKACEAVLDRADTQELSNMLWSFAKLSVRPETAWMQQWLLAMQDRMSSYCAPALAISAYALAVLRFRPPKPWAQALLLETQRQMPAFGAQELSNLVWALAVLGVRPHDAWFRDFEVQALHESGSFNSQELSIIFWSLAKLQHVPGATWVAQLLREGLEVAGGMQPLSLVLLLGSLTRWHLPEMHVAGHYRVLLPRYWAAAEQLLPQYSLVHLSALVAARTKLGHMPTRRWSCNLWRAVQQQLQLAATATPQAQSAQAQSAAAGSISSSTGGSSSSSSRHHVVDLHQQQQAAVSALQAAPPGVLSPAVVSQLVWGAGKLWQKGPVSWNCLRLLLAAAVAVMPHCSCTGLTAIGIGLRSMQQNNKLLVASAVALRRRSVHGRKRQHRSYQGRLLPAAAAALAHKRRPTASAGCWHKQQAQVKTSKHLPSSRASSQKRRCFVTGLRRRRIAARVTSHELWQLAHPVWSAWFSRGTQLLLEANQRAGAQQPSGTATTQWGMQQQQQQQQKQQRGVQNQMQLHGIELSVQLRAVAALRLRAPVQWLQAVQVAVQHHVCLASTEQLSWLLLDLVKVHSNMTPSALVQLPQGLVAAVLSRAKVLHASDEDGWSAPQMQRLQCALTQLKRGGVVSEAEWQQWLRLCRQWQTSQGLRAVRQAQAV